MHPQTPENLCILLIDVQERLCTAMDKNILDQNVQNMLYLLKLAELFSIPVLATEQYPKGLGPLLPEVRDLLPSPPLEKVHFSCAADPAFAAALEKTGRRQVIVCGMETTGESTCRLTREWSRPSMTSRAADDERERYTAQEHEPTS